MSDELDLKERKLVNLLKPIMTDNGVVDKDLIVIALLIAIEDDRVDELIEFIEETEGVNSEDVMLFLVPEDEE